MVSIHDRPVEALGRQVAGHWEGDLLKGTGNASAVGTLVERKSRFVLLAKVDGVLNAIQVEGDLIGRVNFQGPGAGFPTTSAVIADVLDAPRASSPVRRLYAPGPPASWQ
jgi:homoserine dehydrogenase